MFVIESALLSFIDLQWRVPLPQALEKRRHNSADESKGAGTVKLIVRAAFKFGSSRNSGH